MRTFDVDSAMLKWEAALADLQKGQSALAAAMRRYSAGQAEYPYALVATVLRLRGVHERRYDAAAVALVACKVQVEVPQTPHVEYIAPAPAQATGSKWRPHLPARQGGANAAASAQ